MLRKGDKVLIIIITAVCILGYGYKLYTDNKYKNTDSIAIIEVDGQLYGEYNLTKVGNKVINLELSDGGHSVVEFKNGMVRVAEADCPDKVCIRTGWISKSGEVIVCLPYRIVIKISGQQQDTDINVY